MSGENHGKNGNNRKYNGLPRYENKVLTIQCNVVYMIKERAERNDHRRTGGSTSGLTFSKQGEMRVNRSLRPLGHESLGRWDTTDWPAPAARL